MINWRRLLIKRFTFFGFEQLESTLEKKGLLLVFFK